MANIVFQGPAALTLDGKGRLAVPSRHRELLTAMGVTHLTVTKNIGRSLLVYPRPAWESFSERLAALPADANPYKRLLLGNATEVELDPSGRILVAPELRKFAGLERDVMLLGMGHHFELWDDALHAEAEAKLLEAELPASMKNLSF